MADLEVPPPLAASKFPGVTPRAPIPAEDRSRLVARARRLAWGANVWHVFEFSLAAGFGLAASSPALIGFGADSLIEALAGGAVIWRFSAHRSDSAAAERRAQRLVAASFFSPRWLPRGWHPVDTYRWQPSKGELAGHRSRCLHNGDNAPPGTSKAASRPEARFGRNAERGTPEHALRLPVGGAPGRPRGQRAVRVLVGRLAGRARHRNSRRPGGHQQLAGRLLLRGVLT
jgi:hypothetical protein